MVRGGKGLEGHWTILSLAGSREGMVTLGSDNMGGGAFPGLLIANPGRVFYGVGGAAAKWCVM